jgi:monothiol glutaredoxin
MELAEQIKNDIESNPIILYMKGTADRPLCRYSHVAVEVLDYYGVDYKAVNVLVDPEIRVRLSEHSNWPTIPQLFVNGELIGGADIVAELHSRGELLDVLSAGVIRQGQLEQAAL